MKKIAVLTIIFAVGLWAADFWQAKLFTDWSDKEVLKVSTDSPWARQVTVASGGGGGGGEGGGKEGGDKGGKGGGGRGSMGEIGQTSGNGAITGVDTGGGMGGGISLTVRWQSALPVMEALVRMKFGAEAGTSAEAKQILSATQPDYVVVIAGLSRGMVRGDADQLKQAMLASTELIVKGKDPIKPKDFRIVGQGKVDAVFAFPRTNPIVEADKEVEFVSKVGNNTIKQKFRLKDMVFNGKLEL